MPRKTRSSKVQIRHVFKSNTFLLFVLTFPKFLVFLGTIGQSSMGLMFGLIYCAYGLGFWYGNKLIQDHRWWGCMQDILMRILHHREKEEHPNCVLACFHLNDNDTGRWEIKVWDEFLAWIGSSLLPAEDTLFHTFSLFGVSVCVSGSSVGLSFSFVWGKPFACHSWIAYNRRQFAW